MNILTIVAGLSILFLLMLIGREVACWYWKINRAIALLASLDQTATRIEQLLVYMARKGPPS